jgi:hypothetical protein
VSTKAINEVLHYAEKLGRVYDQGVLRRARVEVENIERVAKDLTRLNLGDCVYDVRSSDRVLTETPRGGNTWDHPDVKAWSDAAVLMAAIAKDAT